MSSTHTAYMAPEQAECKSVDERSDIFSFGAVLYEMLSGKRAFPGTSTASILAAILHRSPDPLDAPPMLAGIVGRCLAKAPGDRHQSADELLEGLQEADASESDTMAHSIVRATARKGSLHDDPRFGALRNRVGLPPPQTDKSL